MDELYTVPVTIDLGLVSAPYFLFFWLERCSYLYKQRTESTKEDVAPSYQVLNDSYSLYTLLTFVNKRIRPFPKDLQILIALLTRTDSQWLLNGHNFKLRKRHILVHNRTDMGLFRDPFISIGPLAQERSINLLKKFYEQENPNAPADKDWR